MENRRFMDGCRPSRSTGRLAIGVVTSVILGGLMTGCGGPTWYLDAGFGERRAAEKKRHILYYFKDWDSSAHRNMKKKVLESAAVKKELTDTVNVEIEWKWSGNYKDRYRVMNAQVCVLCSPDGKEAGRMTVNPVPGDVQFAKWLREAKARARGDAATTKSSAIFEPIAPADSALTLQPNVDNGD
jgi:hypothetical protein